MLDKEDEQTIEEINQKIKELQGKVNELKSGKKNVRWRAEKDFFYFSFDGFFDIKLRTEQNDKFDDLRYNLGFYFKTKEEAEKYRQHLIITQKLKDVALRLNNGIEIDWKSMNPLKYSICYNNLDCTLCSSGTGVTKHANGIYCLSDKFLETAIKEIGEQELINYIKEN